MRVVDIPCNVPNTGRHANSPVKGHLCSLPEVSGLCWNRLSIRSLHSSPIAGVFGAHLGRSSTVVDA